MMTTKEPEMEALQTGPGRGRAASRRSISRWIKSTIQQAYSSGNSSIPEGLKAHSTRAVSCSWAERAMATPDQICKAATWSNLHTFTKHYRLNTDLSSDLSFGRKVLQAVVPP
ncbi:hypothetical protein GDO78_013854 [Eleutherodactylus coqui]|uniref:Ndc10 domain-containing protein n=1 Tax=Eleutherodactylus coqui TaxID=57060 RepID=A0A8J6EC28_ELECQ|nr:hypothetical protein GDO78_013854 [Eleutherodactylus coqui]